MAVSHAAPAFRRALLRGPGHIIESIDDGGVELMPTASMIGRPLCEALYGPAFSAAIAAAHQAYLNGEQVSVPFELTNGEPGTVTMYPVIREARVWGVCVVWTRSPQPSRLATLGALVPLASVLALAALLQ